MWRSSASPLDWSARVLGPARAVALAVLTLLAGVLLASSPSAAVTLQFETPISGDVVPVTAELTNLPSGEGVAIDLSIPEGTGDVLGLFGNVVDEGLVPSLGVGDPDGVITQWQFRANKVKKVGGGNVMAPVKGWDWGVKIGATGSPGGVRVETAHFELRAPGLTVDELLSAANQGWVLGVRIQSTSGGEGSSKLGLGAGAPRLRIDAPAEGALLGATPAEVLGTVYGSGVAVDVDGVTAAVAAPDFSAHVPLAEGPNTLVATGTNAEGTATDRVDVVLDTTPPSVEITAPADGALTAGSEVAVEGTVADASPIEALTVNGVAVELTDGTFSTTVPLSPGESPIEAVAVDAAGNEGSDAVSVIRGEPPTVSIGTPADGALLAAKPVTVTGTVSGTPAPEVMVNGTSATVTARSFEAPLTLVEGANALTATATNPLGEASASASVTVDTTPPTVSITAPADGALTAEGEIAVEGTVADASPIAALTLNGTSVPLAGGAFAATVPLSLGGNPIEAAAVDAAGNAGSDAVSVTRGEPPAISISAPTEGALLGEAEVVLSGTATGLPAPEVVVNGSAVPVTDGAFQLPVSLAEGVNELAATATNPLGEASDAVAATVDTTPPVVTLEAPEDGSLTTASELVASGTVADASPIAELTLNGAATSVDAGAFSGPVSLALGESPIEAIAVDAAGNEGSAAVSVTRGEPPSVTIDAPADGATLGASPASVSGSVSGTPPLAVTVAGTSATVGDGSYSASVPLDEGSNLLDVQAMNAFGEASVSVTVALEAGPPLTVAITAPPDGAQVSSEVIAVSGTVSASAGSVSVNGVAADVIDGRWTAPAVRLEGEGEHPLTATALREGESASDSSTVVFERPPEIVITEPAEGATLREPEVPVHGFVDDPTAFVDVNGVDASVGSGGRFTAEAVPLDPGPNRLAARAVDPRGATGRDAVEVTRDDAAAGRLRVVVVDRRVPFELDPFESPFTPIVAESLEEFRRELEALGFPPQGYDAPVAEAAVRTQVWAYVFSELGAPGESVTLEVPEADISLSGSLQGIGELAADLAARQIDAGLAPELVPDDFEPRSFDSFEVEFRGLVVE